MFNAYGCNLEGLVVARASRRAHNTKVLTRSGSNGHFLRVACAMNGVAHVSQTDVSDLIIDGPQQKQIALAIPRTAESTCRIWSVRLTSKALSCA